MTVKVKRICSLGHEETEYTIEEARKVLSEGQGRYLIVKDNKIVNAVTIEDGDQIVLVPVIQGG
jgi:sulfur carrier protein ThiS